MDHDQRFLVRFNFQAMLRLDISDRDCKRIAAVLDLDEGEVLDEIREFDRRCRENAKEAGSGTDLSALDGKSATIVFAGDSCTSDRLSYMNILRQVFAGLPGIRLVDSAVSGWRSGDILQDYRPKVLDQEPDILVYAMGLNDMRRICGEFNTTSIAEFKRNIRTTLQGLEGTPAIVNTMPPTHAGRIQKSFGDLCWAFDERDWEDYNKTLCDTAEECGAQVNDTRQAFFEAIRQGRDVYYDDGLHQSEAGQCIVAKSLLPMLVDAIGKI